MTDFGNWLHAPAARALGLALVHFLWEGIAIAAALALALLFLRPARARYGAACVALTAMLAACAATFVLVLPQAEPRHVALNALPQPPANTAGSPAAPAPHFPIPEIPQWVVPVWLAGVLLLHARTLAGWTAARRLRRSGVCSAPPPWPDRLQALAARLGLSRSVALLESCRADVPLVIGYLRPAILMPLGLVAQMPIAQVEAILLHELAHIRRRDYLVNLAQALAENLLFYHPAVWWVSGVIRAERENCCDDLAVAVQGDARQYAAALTALEETRWAAEPALAATGGNLVQRIHRLLQNQEPRHTALRPALTAALIMVTAAAALAAWQPKPQQAPQEKALSYVYDVWLNEDVVYIITNQERAAFLRLTTDAERDKFIDQFWERRNPVPGSPKNEFKSQHEYRLGYVTGKYTIREGIPGWKTDRGRVYILYGPPDEIESHPTGQPQRDYPFEQWLYRHLDGVGDNIIIEFADRDHSGRYRLSASAIKLR